jgi:hypothetical protein
MSVAPDTHERSETSAERAAAVRALLEAEVPAMIARSIAAFRRDLPELLKTHRGRWVAYHGDERLGFGRRHTPLYQECLRRGLSRDEFIVTVVEAWAFDPDEEVEVLYDDV